MYEKMKSEYDKVMAQHEAEKNQTGRYKLVNEDLNPDKLREHQNWHHDVIQKHNSERPPLVGVSKLKPFEISDI